MRRSVYCTASFSVCSLRRAKFPIIYPDLRLDYKVATHPAMLRTSCRTLAATGRLKSGGIAGVNRSSFTVLVAGRFTIAVPASLLH